MKVDETLTQVLSGLLHRSLPPSSGTTQQQQLVTPEEEEEEEERPVITTQVIQTIFGIYSSLDAHSDPINLFKSVTKSIKIHGQQPNVVQSPRTLFKIPIQNTCDTVRRCRE